MLLVIMDNLQTVPSYSVNKNIPIEVLIGYSQQGLSAPEIGKLVGCSPTNIYQRFQTVNYTPQHLESFKKNRADLMAQKQRELLSALDSEAIKRMAPRDVVVSYGILYDKERLERGQATSITGYEGLPDDGLLLKMQSLLDKASKIGIRITEIVGEIPASIRASIPSLPGPSLDGLCTSEHNLDGIGK